MKYTFYVQRGCPVTFSGCVGGRQTPLVQLPLSPSWSRLAPPVGSPSPAFIKLAHVPGCLCLVSATGEIAFAYRSPMRVTWGIKVFSTPLPSFPQRPRAEECKSGAEKNADGSAVTWLSGTLVTRVCSGKAHVGKMGNCAGSHPSSISNSNNGPGGARFRLSTTLAPLLVCLLQG